MKPLSEAIESALRPLADPDRALPMAAYMQHHFRFLGISTPHRRQATQGLLRAFTGDPVAAAEDLWCLAEREFQYVAVDLLRRHARQLSAAHSPALVGLAERRSWWDTVDGLAVVIGGVVRQQPELVSRMDALLVSSNGWLRRIALLHQLDWKAATDRDRLFAYCLQCADEREFFIRKAIGWALRQYARTDPEAVRRFVTDHADRLSGLSRREATKHLAT